MAPKGVTDKYASMIYGSVTETGANTLTFQKLETGYGSLNKVGWIIHRLEYYIGLGSQALVIANDDALQMAITKSNLISSLTLDQAAVVDMMSFQIQAITGVGFADRNMPIIRSFTDLPGGGKLVLPYPLYLAARGISIASATTVAARIYFTEVELSNDDWVELVEQTRLLV